MTDTHRPHRTPRAHATGLARLLLAGMVALLLTGSLGPLGARAAESATSEPAPAPELSAPADGDVVDGLPRFEWTMVADPGAAGDAVARLEVTTDADAGFDQLVAAVETTDPAYQQIQELDPTIAYRWRVGRIGSDGAVDDDDWSAVRTFTLATPPVEEPATTPEPPVEPTLATTETVATEVPATETGTETALPVDDGIETGTGAATETTTTEETVTQEAATEEAALPVTVGTETPGGTEATDVAGAGTVDAAVSPTATATPAASAKPKSTKAATKSATRTAERRAQAASRPVVIPASRLSGTLGVRTGLPVAGASRSNGSRSSGAVTDRDLVTIWTSAPTTPREASVTVKLDRSRSIGAIRWMWGLRYHGDRVRIEVSRDQVTWTRVATIENAPTGQWQSLDVNVYTKYVRFRFENPNHDRWVGGLAEVEVDAGARIVDPPPVASPTPTATPKPQPETDGVITNPSFERGAVAWHTEQGAGVVEGVARGGDNAMRLMPEGGYAGQWVTLDAGSVQELTGWGKLGAPHDVGQIGIVFFDRDGARLRDLEPRMLAFTTTTFTAAALRFGVPDRVAKVVVTIYKEAGGARFYVDDLAIRAVPGGETPPTPKVTCQHLMLPGYFDPATGLWDRATASGTGLGMAVFNPNSGPGDRYSAAYAARIAAARAAGITPLGYVYAKYGQRPIADVLADIDRFAAWYGITDIYLDNGATSLDQLDYFRSVLAYVHDGGGIGLVNFGWAPNPAYMAFVDIANIYEDSGAVYETGYDRPVWIDSYPATRFSAQIYDTPADRMDAVVALSRERNAAYVWISDDAGSPLYKTLPTYWDAINRAVAAGC